MRAVEKMWRLRCEAARSESGGFFFRVVVIDWIYIGLASFRVFGVNCEFKFECNFCVLLSDLCLMLDLVTFYCFEWKNDCIRKIFGLPDDSSASLR